MSGYGRIAPALGGMVEFQNRRRVEIALDGLVATGMPSSPQRTIRSNAADYSIIPTFPFGRTLAEADRPHRPVAPHPRPFAGKPEGGR